MHLLDRATVIHWHRHRIAAHGLGSTAALGWREPASQLSRFEAVADAADCTGRRVLDVGCGTGDLLPHLAKRYDGLQYLGIDLVPEFIDHARRHHAARHPSAQFELADAFHAATPLPQADVVVACGALSYRSRDSGFFERALQRLWAATAQTLVVSLLDAEHFNRAHPDHPLLTGHDLPTVLEQARRLGAQVQLQRGAPPDSVTVVLTRAGGPGDRHPARPPRDRAAPAESSPPALNRES